ncbi:MAG: hypothetical protein NZZ41_05400 [Candidatus Dojkabacteria bacterium]|nr:hypothetical protein [Candidatus Dojkabacteria bacterium]
MNTIPVSTTSFSLKIEHRNSGTRKNFLCETVNELHSILLQLIRDEAQFAAESDQPYLLRCQREAFFIAAETYFIHYRNMFSPMFVASQNDTYVVFSKKKFLNWYITISYHFHFSGIENCSKNI